MGPRHTRIIATTTCYPPRRCSLVSDWSVVAGIVAAGLAGACREAPAPGVDKNAAPLDKRAAPARWRSVIWLPSSRCPAATGSSTAWSVIEAGRPSSSPGSPRRSQKVERPNAAHSVRVGITSARSTSPTSPSASIPGNEQGLRAVTWGGLPVPQRSVEDGRERLRRRRPGSAVRVPVDVLHWRRRPDRRISTSV